MADKAADIRGLIDSFCDTLENTTQTRRTRLNNNSNPTRTEVFQHPNADESIWYEHPQLAAEHRFDCCELREMDATEALDLIVGAVADQLVIADQRIKRFLSPDAFSKAYGNSNGVEIDVLEGLRKKSKSADPVGKAVKALEKATPEQRRRVIEAELKKLGFESIEDFQNTDADAK
jgi:hypothetical protein